MIKKRIIKDDEGHIIISANEPMRIEIQKCNGGYILHGYKGTKIDIEQEPCLFHNTEEV